jgi:hypothetical protein
VTDVHLRMSAAQQHKLDVLAERANTTRSGVVRRLIDAAAAGFRVPGERLAESELLDLLNEQARAGQSSAIIHLLAGRHPMTDHMTDPTDPIDPLEDERCVALDHAIDAGAGAIQAAAALWEMLTPAEQDCWLGWAAVITPRRNVALKTLLPAADKVLSEMRAAGS